MAVEWIAGRTVETDDTNVEWIAGYPWMITGGSLAYTIECTAGTYAVTGATLNALYGRKATCTAGTYAITGATLNPLVGYKATCTAGSYLVTGAELDPVYQENVTISPSVFSVVLVFNAPNITLGQVIMGGELHMFMDLSLN